MRLVFLLLVYLGSCVGNDSFLDHLLTRQQKDVADYIPASKWSIFDVFASETDKESTSKHTTNKEHTKKSPQTTQKYGSGWKKNHPGTAVVVTSPKFILPTKQSAVASGGLLPTKIYVINSDRLFERWLGFRERWSLVNGHSGNFSVSDASNPVRFRGADFGERQEGEEGRVSMSWKRRLDVLPPRTRKTALECRDVAFSRDISGALAYGLSHLALWESIAMGRLKNEDRILILDDSARPRQHWVDALEKLAAGIPKDWDLISLGWWGSSRDSDSVGDGSANRVNPPFRVAKDGKWECYYGGAHARLVRGRVVKKMVVAMSKIVKPPNCDLFWPDGDVAVWANQTGVNYYALKNPLFGLVKEVNNDFETWVNHAVEGPALVPISEDLHEESRHTVPQAWSRGKSRYDVSAASIKRLRAKMPAGVKCRTIISGNGIEREVCT
jgi:hypothetical protein